MHELRILRLLHRRVFWKCDFSCELFILPTCVPLLICTLLRAAGDGCGAVTGDCSAVTTAGRVLDRGPLLPRAAAARDLDCVCRDVAAGRRDADGRHVPGRHGHAAALPIAAPSAPPRARRAKVGARLFRIYVRLTVVCPTLVAKRGEGN